MIASFQPAVLCAAFLAAAALALGACGGDDAEPATEPAAIESEAQAEDAATDDPSRYSSGARDDPAVAGDGASADGNDTSTGNGTGSGSGGASGGSSQGAPEKSEGEESSGRDTEAGVFGVATETKPVAPGSDRCRVKLQGRTATVPCEAAEKLSGR